MAGIFVAWALGAAALAIFVIRGQDCARVLLVISAACAGLLGLLMAFASPFLPLVAAACAYVVYALTRRSASDWFRDQTRLRRERSEEHTSELQSLMRSSYAVFCLKKEKIAIT